MDYSASAIVNNRRVGASALSSPIDIKTSGAGIASTAAEAAPETLKDSPSLRKIGGEIPVAPDEEQMCVGGCMDGDLVW